MITSSALIAAALGIGFVAGLRSFMAPAAVSWAAHAGWLNLHDSPLWFMSSTAAVVVLSLLALGELVADKLPMTPSRINPGPLMGRVSMGGVAGAVIAIAAEQPLWLGVVVGGAGAAAGAFAGYHTRRRLVGALGGKDFGVAVLEDLLALALGYFVVATVAARLVA